MLHRALLITTFLVLPATAFADVRYDMQVHDMKSGSVVNNEILSKDGMLRMGVSANAKGVETDVIYRPKEEEMMIVDNKRKEVRTMTKDDIERMGNMMAGFSKQMQQMQESMKNMPPEARAKVEEMMAKMGPAGSGAPKAEPTVSSLGKSDTVAGIKCDMYEMKVDGVKKQEFCAADPDDITGGDELVSAMQGMAEFMKSLTQASGAGNMDAYVEPVEGKFPILSRQFEDGKVINEARLAAIEEVDLSADKFKAPKGYKQRKLMER